MSETLDEIVAWIRELVKSYRQSIAYDKVTIEGLKVSVALEKIACRIEAARKRELGNTATMREALEYLLEERDILDFCHNNLSSKTWEDWDKVYKVLRKIIEKAMRALAAPPRNCDRFGGDIDKLREACARERGLNPEEDFPDVFPDWLLAPSTAKESEVQG